MRQIINIKSFYDILKGGKYFQGEIDLSDLEITKSKVVDELPEVGEKNTIYFLRKVKETGEAYCDEYMWIDERWEVIGSTEVVIDIEGDYPFLKYMELIETND